MNACARKNRHEIYLQLTFVYSTFRVCVDLQRDNNKHKKNRNTLNANFQNYCAIGFDNGHFKTVNTIDFE